MIKVKICGLNTESSVVHSVKCGASYIGFVFYKKSPRNINLNIAIQLSKLIPSTIKKVGLFVDPTIGDLEKSITKISLDYIQLHGDETPDHVRRLD